MMTQERRSRALGGLQRKVVSAETKALDDHRVYAILSTESVDREGDVIRAAGWVLDNFMQHPILLSSHDYFSLRSQIGEWEDVRVEGRQLVGVARYYVGEGNDEADWGYKLAARGKAAYSVGFIPDMDKAKELKGGSSWWPNYEFNGQELLECSHVTVPANPDALQQMKAMRLDPAVAEVVDDLLREASPEQVAAAIAAKGLVKSPDMMAQMQGAMGHMHKALALMESMMGDMSGEVGDMDGEGEGKAASAATETAVVDYRALAEAAIAGALKELTQW